MLERQADKKPWFSEPGSLLGISGSFQCRHSHGKKGHRMPLHTFPGWSRGIQRPFTPESVGSISSASLRIPGHISLTPNECDGDRMALWGHVGFDSISFLEFFIL